MLPAANDEIGTLPDAARSARSASALKWAVVVSVVTAFLMCLVTLAATVGVTVDEPSHFLSGHLYWQGRDNLRPGDMRPLIKIVSGWAPLVMQAPAPPPTHDELRDCGEWT